ncbi:hypothetical protein BCR32DRAFT_277171 [Anaeromyces robustus]|jgi:lipopolysaccharide biosynthesis glycosyltransferase|uniref:glycogenin glucosyltransferase n=1 Tax=Anaeromyces robustus TaxID=1754192 RepID=A0A1Y1XFA9_9FUNG|nr:hypothetical protein BCR32DRAFT_277171 [Anaeromyces robustus]|eukprot:ORX84372.1 hypothetical protein BCR32DRAFT_277171 [Anaeromyces robustus]
MTDAYVTLVTSDNYVSGAVTLAHSLRLSGTNKQIVCMVTPEVSSGSKDYLLDPGHLYDELITVEPFNSFDTANLSLLGRPELGITLTKINVWNLLQYRYVVFIDADAMVLRNIDELFDRLERADTIVNSEVFAAAPDTGWPDNFNSGLFACKPSVETYSNLKALALSSGSFDGADQGLLNRYFKNWSNTSYGRLSFTFNVTPSAYYSYAPAYAEYMSNIKVVHFIGPEKPWNWNLRFADGKIMPRGFTSHQFKELAMQWWNIRDDFDEFKRNGYKKVEYVPPTPPPEPQYYEAPREEHYEPPHEEYHEPPHEEYHEPPHEEYHEAPREAYYEPPPPPPEPEPQPQHEWESWSTWHPTDNAWQAPQPANNYNFQNVEDFSQSQSYPNFEVVTPPEQAPREEPFTFVDYPKPPHIHDIMQAYDNKQNEPENVDVYEEEVDDDDMKKMEENNYYSFNQAPIDDFSHYKVGWNFGELSGFKPHREKMTEEEQESNRLFMNLPGIRVNALYDTTPNYRDVDYSSGDHSYKYDPSATGPFAEYGNLTEKPTYEVSSEYGSENQSFVREPSYNNETQETEADLDNYDLYGYSYVPSLRRKKSESNMSITSETPSGHRRMSRRRSIASSISMDFEDFQYNKNTFGINEDDPYNYNGVIENNFHDDLFEDVDVYDGMYMDQQEPYTDENASYNEDDLQNDGYFPEEFDELKKNKVTDTINITQVTNEIAMPENKNTVVVSDTYITKQKEEDVPEESIEGQPKEAEVPEVPEESIEGQPKEAEVPEVPEESAEAQPKEAEVPEVPVETLKDQPKEAEVPEVPEESVEGQPKEAEVPEVPEESVEAQPKEAEVPEVPEESAEAQPKEVEVPEVPKESVEAQPKEAITPAQKAEPKKSKKSTKTTKKTIKTEPEIETEIVEEEVYIEIDPVTGEQTIVSKKGGLPKDLDPNTEVVVEEEEIIEEIDPKTGKRTIVSKKGTPAATKVEAQPREAVAPTQVESQPREAAAPAGKAEQSKSKKTTKKTIKKTVNDESEVEIVEEEVYIEIDPKTGKRTTISKKGTPAATKVESQPREAVAPAPKAEQSKSKKTTKTIKKVVQAEPEIETEVVEEEVYIEIDPVTGKQTVVSKKGGLPKDLDPNTEVVIEEEEIIEEIDPKTGKRTIVSKKGTPAATKVEAQPREAVVPATKTDSKKSNKTTKKTTKKIVKSEPEIETEVVEEEVYIEIDPKTGKETIVSKKGGLPKDLDPNAEITVEEEEILEEIDPKTGKRTVISKSGIKPKTETKSVTTAREVKPAETVVTQKEVVPPPKKEVKKKVTTKPVPPNKITVSSSKKVVTGSKETTTSTTKVKVIKKVIRKSPSGRILEVKELPDDTPVSNTKVTRTIVIKNKDGDVVDTKTMEGSVDDIENQTNSLIGSGLVNVTDDSNHVSTKIRRTIIRKNADGEILSTEVKNINDQESLDNMKPISLLSFNKNKSSSSNTNQ